MNQTISGAYKADIDLEGHKVTITVSFASRYEAAIAFDDIKAAAESGSIGIRVKVDSITSREG